MICIAPHYVLVVGNDIIYRSGFTLEDRAAIARAAAVRIAESNAVDGTVLVVPAADDQTPTYLYETLPRAGGLNPGAAGAIDEALIAAADSPATFRRAVCA